MSKYCGQIHCQMLGADRASLGSEATPCEPQREQAQKGASGRTPREQRPEGGAGGTVDIPKEDTMVVVGCVWGGEALELSLVKKCWSKPEAQRCQLGSPSRRPHVHHVDHQVE
jgi:hypothetical protein